MKDAEQKVRILYEIARFVSSFLHLHHVLDAIVDLLVREFRLDACSIRQLDNNDNLRIMSHKGLSMAFIEQSTRKPTIDSYSGDCFLTGKIVIINDADRIDKSISTNLIVSENIKSFALCPIKIEGEIIGVLGNASKKKNYFHESFNDIIYTVANQIGIAIRISQLYKEIYSMTQDLENKVKERTAELEKRTQQLIAAEKRVALGEMSSIIAHELRNSLMIVGGFTRRLYEKIIDDDPDKKDIKIILDEVRVLEEKVSKIINLGKSDNI
ncbi:GAF domain-containing protein [Thermodesulfobacteriota bacterium]